MEFLPSSFNEISVFLLVTPFVGIATALSIWRIGIGLNGAAMSVVILIAACALSLQSVPKELSNVGGFEAVIQKKETAVNLVKANIEKKIGKHEESKIIETFILYQLKEGAKLGLYFLIPFILIDLLVLNAGALLGVQGVTHTGIALCLKLLLFLSVEGFTGMFARLAGL